MERSRKREKELQYKKEKRKQIVLNISIEEDETIKAYCTEHNTQVATWIKSLIRKEIKENAKPVE